MTPNLLSLVRPRTLLSALALALGLHLPLNLVAQSGNTPADPYELGALENSRVVTGSVQTEDPDDVYRFDIDRSVRAVDLLIPRTSLEGYVELILAEDRNGNALIEDDEILADDRGYSGGDARLQVWLNPGTYFARVRASRGYESAYRLTLSQSAHAESAGAGDDSLALALQRPPLAPNTLIRDYVGPADPADLYSFTVTGQVHQVRVVIPQTSLTGYLRLQLIRDDNGNLVPEEDEVLDAATGYSGATAAVEAWLNPGQYFVRVAHNTGYHTAYELTLSQTAKEASGGALDDSLALAYQRPLLAHARPVSDYVGAADPADFYRFEVVGSVAEVQVILPRASLTGYAELSLLRDDNQNGVVEDTEVLEESTGYSGVDARVLAWLDPGTYYVRVAALRGYGPNYTLTLSQTAKPFSAGNRDNQATTPAALGHILSPRQIDDFVGPSDPVDVYRFEVTGPRRKVTLLLPRENLTGYARLRLSTDVNQDAILEPLVDDTGYSGVSASIELELAPGTYYVEILHYPNDSTPYRLVISRTFASNVPPFVILPPA
ncbi:MAG: hypothetical protein IT580_11145, partial [Verrucomicrobiales bacterium]|nr:hypothetical protein [Verrucomicrobiales bacterium]